MIQVSMDTEHSIVTLRPKGALEKRDFVELGRLVDPHIEANGRLAGIIVEFKVFPGWENLGALAAHVKFVKGHHTKVKKIAAVTDAALGKVAEKLGAVFVDAEIRRFRYGKTNAARTWILGESGRPR